MAKIPGAKIVDAAKEQPLHSTDDTDSAVSGHVLAAKSKMSDKVGLPHMQSGKMPHEHFQEKMTKALC